MFIKHSGDDYSRVMNFFVKVSVMLGFMFIQSVIATLLPKSNKTPLLADYLLSALVLSTLNLIVSAILILVYNLGKSNSSTVRRIERRLRRHNTSLLRIYSFGLFWCKPGSSRSPMSSNRRQRERDEMELPLEERQTQFVSVAQSGEFSPHPLQIDVNDTHSNYATTRRPLLVGPERSQVVPINVSTFENSRNRGSPKQFNKTNGMQPNKTAKTTIIDNGDESRITPRMSPHSASNSYNDGDSKSRKRGNEQNDHNTTGNEERASEHVERHETCSKNKPKLDYDPEEFWHRMGDFINRIATSLLILSQLLIVIFFLVPIFV